MSPPGAAGIAQTPSYAPEGDTGAVQPRPQTTTEALTAAYRLCEAEGVPAPGHRRMVRLVKDYLATRRRIDEHFGLLGDRLRRPDRRDRGAERAAGGPAMTLGNDDRRLHDGERRTDERLAGLLHHTPQRPQTPFWHAVADVRVVVGRGGVPRLVLLVARCPGCHRPHMHLARVPFTATIRKAGCGTRYTVHALNDEAVA